MHNQQQHQQPSEQPPLTQTDSAPTITTNDSTESEIKTTVSPTSISTNNPKNQCDGNNAKKSKASAIEWILQGLDKGAKETKSNVQQNSQVLEEKLPVKENQGKMQNDREGEIKRTENLSKPGFTSLVDCVSEHCQKVEAEVANENNMQTIGKYY